MNEENKNSQMNDNQPIIKQPEVKKRELIPTWLGFVIVFLVLIGLFLLFMKFKSITAPIQ